MGKYTAYGNKVDEYIEKNYLDKIIDSFVGTIGDNLISIILFGGFGKGEGSIQAINGKPVPYNDFDLYVVTEEKLSDEELDRISMNASLAIGMGGLEIAYYPEEGYDSNKYFHVDVRCIPYDKLGRLMSIQRYYELKYGSQVIYGKKDVLDKINEIKKEDIPTSDGLRNLFNRFHQMLLGLQKEYNRDQKNVRIFWSYKCYMSICEALLILGDKFPPTIPPTTLERSKVFSEIYEESFPDLYEILPNLPEKVQIATEFKLKPNFKIDAENLWNEALNDILIVFRYYIKRMTDCDDISEAINEKLPFTYFKPFLKEKIGFNFWPSQYVLNLGYLNVLRKEKEFYLPPLFQWKDVGLRMILPIYYLLKFKSSNNEEYLDNAYEELKKFIRVEEKREDISVDEYFWYLRERVLRAYGLYYEQRLL